MKRQNWKRLKIFTPKCAIALRLMIGYDVSPQGTLWPICSKNCKFFDRSSQRVAVVAAVAICHRKCHVSNCSYICPRNFARSFIPSLISWNFLWEPIWRFYTLDGNHLNFGEKTWIVIKFAKKKTKFTWFYLWIFWNADIITAKTKKSAFKSEKANDSSFTTKKERKSPKTTRAIGKLSNLSQQETRSGARDTRKQKTLKIAARSRDP